MSNSKIPRLSNLNSTEYWMLREMMTAGVCDVSSHGFAESFICHVTTPSGDRYVLYEMCDVLDCVRKLKKDETF